MQKSKTIVLRQNASAIGLRPIVYSHGWYALEPFEAGKNPLVLSYAASIYNKPVVLDISENRAGSITVRIESAGRVDTTHTKAVRALVRSMLRLDEPFGDFYRAIGGESALRWIKKAGGGRLLRGGTFFEDLIKMVCTTNCSWALTTIMVRNLCQTLGTETPRGKRTFPTPAAIAGQSEAFLRKEIRAGYRAPYILELSELAASGKMDIEAFRRSDLPTDELYRELQALKGVGPYAAESLLKLLGRYDHLGLDSWTRKKYGQIYHNGRKVTDRTIERRYRKYGTWAGLVFWLEMTKEWYEGDVVF